MGVVLDAVTTGLFDPWKLVGQLILLSGLAVDSLFAPKCRFGRPAFDNFMKGVTRCGISCSSCVDPAGEPYEPKEDNIQSWVSEMDKTGVRVMGNRLVEADKAVTVRKRKGKS